VSQGTVHRRHVFFLAGFDPKGAGYYHRLYRTQASLQGPLTGVTYAVGSRERLVDGNTAWEVHTRENGGAEVRTTIEHVRWDDVVRAHWPRSWWQVLAGSVKAYWGAITSRSLGKVRQASPRTLVALAWPAVFWIVAVLMTAVAWACAQLLARALGAPFPWPLAAGIAAAAIAGRFALAWDRRLNTSWLLRIYQFAHAWSRGRTPEVPPLVNKLARSMAGALRDPHIDEVLLVGFSVGSMLAVAATARLKDMSAADPVPLDKLSVLTLGHCIPLLGLMPDADAFRADLRTVAAWPAVFWADYSSPVDWGSFPLVDPIGICVDVQDRATRVHVASPRFHTMFPRDVYESMRREKRRMHLQYLMAGQIASDYDYFAITAGSLSLPARLSAQRAP
jgi:hypothetical protein